MPLTDKACKAAAPAGKPYKISDAHGLFLQVHPNGSKYWRYKYRYMGKEKLLSFGVYPEVSLREARDKRDEARKCLREGANPSDIKKEQRRILEAKNENSFEKIAREWHSTNLDRWSPAYGKTILHRLETDIFPAMGNAPISGIGAPDLLKTIREIENRGAREMAHRSIQVCGQIFRYAIVTGRADRNPAADLRGALKPVKKGHYAALDSAHLPAFIKALENNDARLYIQTRLSIKLLMLTFVRTGEMIGATWDEFNFDTKEWIIPASRMKMKREHIVPLSTQVIHLLEELKDLAGNRPYILPSQINPRKHMSNNTILKALERMGYKGQMTGHGFRALAMSTIKEKLGYRHEVVDRQLAHAPSSKIEAAYDRAKFLDDRKIMMQEWADFISGIEVKGN